MATHLVDEGRRIKVRRKLPLYDIVRQSLIAYVAATMGIRILSKKELRQLVLYSPAHIDRLEKAGRFPKRVQLGPCRVGWVESEVMAWLEQRIKERDLTAPGPLGT
jgi:prophage regulatory protein